MVPGFADIYYGTYIRYNAKEGNIVKWKCAIRIGKPKGEENKREVKSIGRK